MSEYQYYEFRAVDRPLDKRQMAELRALSTRATITPTSFVNVYHWGDFRGDPVELMKHYFDAFVYTANWGTHWTMLRVPRRLIDVEALRPHCDAESASLHLTRDHAVLEFRSEQEPGDWEEGEERWLPSLLPLREEVIAGDLRCLYFGWLTGVQNGEVDADEPEPPVPPGLRSLSAALEAFAKFLRIDPDLLAIAAERDTGPPPTPPSRKQLASWVAGLPGSEKDAFLLRLAEEEAPLLRRELLHRFRESTAGRGQALAAEGRPRTAGQLRSLWEARAEEERRREAERRAAAEARRARERAEARARHLDALARRQAEAWQEVEAAVQSKLPKEYDRAVELLVDLRELAEREGKEDEAARRIQDIRDRHARKPTFIERLKKAGLTA